MRLEMAMEDTKSNKIFTAVSKTHTKTVQQIYNVSMYHYVAIVHVTSYQWLILTSMSSPTVSKLSQYGTIFNHFDVTGPQTHQIW